MVDIVFFIYHRKGPSFGQTLGSRRSRFKTAAKGKTLHALKMLCLSIDKPNLIRLNCFCRMLPKDACAKGASQGYAFFCSISIEIRSSFLTANQKNLILDALRKNKS